MNPACDNNWRERKSSEINSAYDMIHPSQDDKNRNNTGGIDQQRSLNRGSYNSNSFCYFSSEDQGNFRSKPRRKYPNARH